MVKVLQKIMNDATLITGGSGLLGSNLKGGRKPIRSELDILDYQSLREYINRYGIRKIVHAAAMVGGVQGNTDRVCDFFLDNLTMNNNILRACREFKLTDSIFISSTCVFPSNAPLPLQEEYIHLGEPHFTNYGYAYAKRMLEVGSRVLKQQYDIKTLSLITTNFYGENDNHHLEHGHIIPSLIHKCHLAKHGKTDFVIWGTGTPKREFNYVGDLARIVDMIYEGHEIGIEYPPAMIVSSGYEYSVHDVVDMIVKKMGFEGNVVFDNTKPNGIERKNSSNALFSEYFPDFSWTRLEDGIDVSIDYFENNYPKVRK